LKDAILLRKTVGRKKMGLGIVNQVPAIVKNTVTANNSIRAINIYFHQKSHLDLPNGLFIESVNKK